ncbi:MAG: DoxX family membrane protein [Deltaproteobacteria bacterium]|nr:DoxX family membrane protein [Deltaproteobacteria bacterium]
MERKCVINFALMRPVIILVLRVILGIVFVVAAYGKLLHPDALVSTVINFNILPLGLAKIFAETLPWIEMIGGIMLIIGFGTRGASFALGWLLVSFIIAIWINIHRGVSMDCGCFDLFGMNEKIGSAILIRDIVFLIVAIALVFTKDFMLSIDTVLERKTIK